MNINPESNEQFKETETERNDAIQLNINKKNSCSELNYPIIKQLKELGYHYNLIIKLIIYFNVRSIEQAMEYLSKENGILQHCFIPDKNSEIQCIICQQAKELHLRNNVDDTNYPDMIKKLQKSQNEKFLIIKNQNVTEVCQICEEKYLKNGLTQLNLCLHSFCERCWTNYLTICIKEKKQVEIKCMDYSCNSILPYDFIYNYFKYDGKLLLNITENKIKEEILNNPKEKFCPFPNCNSYAIKENDNENVQCGNGHFFCFKCLQEPHELKECIIKFDDEMEKSIGKKFIKKCPNCNTWTEKINGCNHITCKECNYHWCFICSKEYTSDHYIKSKCEETQGKDVQIIFEEKTKFRKANTIIDNPNYGLNIFAKFGLILLFFLIGYIIFIIYQFGEFLTEAKKIRFYRIILFCAILFYFLFIIIFQIYINIFLFIIICSLNSMTDLFDDFYSYLSNIRNGIFFSYQKNVIYDTIDKLLSPFRKILNIISKIVLAILSINIYFILLILGIILLAVTGSLKSSTKTRKRKRKRKRSECVVF